GASQDHVTAGHQIVVVIFLQHKAGGAADRDLAMEDRHREGSHRKPVDALAVLSGGEYRHAGTQQQWRCKFAHEIPPAAMFSSADAGKLMFPPARIEHAFTRTNS